MDDVGNVGDASDLKAKYNRLLRELDVIKKSKAEKGCSEIAITWHNELKLTRLQFKLREILDVKTEMRYGVQKPKVIVRTPETLALIDEIKRMRKEAGLPD